jgi:hypothetical protein
MEAMHDARYRKMFRMLRGETSPGSTTTPCVCLSLDYRACKAYGPLYN